MEVYGIIYTLINGTNDKEYVGQTTRTFAERFYQHAHGDQYIDRVIQKHGADLFATAILKICYSQEELDFWEKHLIKSRDTMSPNGYNLIEGGIGTTGKNNPFFGKRHKAESLAKMSESHRGNTAWVGRNHRQESKTKMSAWRRADTPFKNLLAEMDKRQITYKDLAEILGVARMTLPEKMRGIKGFKAIEVIKVVEFFGLPAEYLMARDDGQIFSPSKDSPFKNLLMEMDKYKITYRELAKLLGFKSETTVSAKMHGRQNFTKKDIAKLVEIFGLPEEYLLEHNEELPTKILKSESGVESSVRNRVNSPYKNLLNEIDKYQLTYTSLAKLLGLSRPTVSIKMLGKQNFTKEQIAKLVEIFGKPAEYLMKRDEFEF